MYLVIIATEPKQTTGALRRRKKAPQLPRHVGSSDPIQQVHPPNGGANKKVFLQQLYRCTNIAPIFKLIVVTCVHDVLACGD